MASEGHIMLSYQWDYQKQVIKIKDALKAHGFKVWMDVDKMNGSIYDKMAEGVEGASAIIVCMSSTYQCSDSCNSEFQYAKDKKKDIIPIKVESGFNATGALGLITAGRLYIDFSDSSKFDENLRGLKQEIESLTGTVLKKAVKPAQGSTVKKADQKDGKGEKATSNKGDKAGKKQDGKNDKATNNKGEKVGSTGKKQDGKNDKVTNSKGDKAGSADKKQENPKNAASQSNQTKAKPKPNNPQPMQPAQMCMVRPAVKPAVVMTPFGPVQTFVPVQQGATQLKGKGPKRSMPAMISLGGEEPTFSDDKTINKQQQQQQLQEHALNL